MSKNKQMLETIVHLLSGDVGLIHEQVCYREVDFGGNAWTAASVNTAYNICTLQEAIYEELGDLHLYRNWKEKCEEIGAVMVALAKKGGAA